MDTQPTAEGLLAWRLEQLKMAGDYRGIIDKLTEGWGLEKAYTIVTGAADRAAKALKGTKAATELGLKFAEEIARLDAMVDRNGANLKYSYFGGPEGWDGWDAAKAERGRKMAMAANAATRVYSPRFEDELAQREAERAWGKAIAADRAWHHYMSRGRSWGPWGPG
ncbi:MAG TPA: hypothetical protein VGQ85_02875 [Candidatus Limnocylindrales bacterium]|nr:hypothetical protein [Candidatus Limnocylindrales bacterium]